MTGIHSISEFAEKCRAKISNVETNLSQDMKDAVRTGGKIAICERLDEFYSPGTIEDYRYNLLKRMPERYDPVKKEYVTVSDDDFNTFQLMTEKTLMSNGLKQLSKEHIRTIYDLITHAQEVDPFFDYISQFEWDGVPRLRRWFIDGLGAHIPSLTPEESDFLVEETTQAWFMGAVKRSQHIQKFETVPILMSKQQGVGKTTYIQYTALYSVDTTWYKSTSTGIDDPRRFFESVSGGKIIEWGEAPQLKRRDNVEEMKAFISREEDTYREPYARMTSSVSRRWVPIITTNETTLFSDVTGNRRFIPFVCDSSRITRKAVKYDRISNDYTIDPDLLYDAQQVWAEALVMDKEGKLACLPPEAEKLARVPQKEFMKGNDFIDALYSKLDKNYPSVGTFLPVDEVRRMMRELYDDFPEMKFRRMPVTVIAEYHDEWEYSQGRVPVHSDDGKVVGSEKARGIRRVKKSPRIEYNNIYDFQE